MSSFECEDNFDTQIVSKEEAVSELKIFGVSKIFPGDLAGNLPRLNLVVSDGSLTLKYGQSVTITRSAS